MRIAQYVHMASVSDAAIRPYPLIKDYLPSEFKLMELGEKLYGFKPWKSKWRKHDWNPDEVEQVNTEREIIKRRKKSTIEILPNDQ